MKNLTLLTTLSIAFFAFAVSGCQTLEGAGKDVENAGESIQDAAN